MYEVITSTRQEYLDNCWIAVNSNDYATAKKIYDSGAKRFGRRLFGSQLRIMIANGLFFNESVTQR